MPLSAAPMDLDMSAMLAQRWSDIQLPIWAYQVDQTARGADFLQRNPATVPTRGLTSWLVDEVRSAIADGRLAPGSRLPATSILATDLAVSRGVVVEAYCRLPTMGP
jgi:GntR family transcriptional regulator/MocR family aminotransferase